VEIGGGARLELMPLGHRWAVDPFVILHNAVRRELLDLLGVVESVEARIGALEESDKGDFCEWWAMFQKMVTESFGIENRMVFPWVFNAVLPNGMLDPAMVDVKNNIVLEQQALSRKFVELSLIIQGLTSINMKETFQTLVPKLRSLMIAFVAYFKRQEKLLISAIEPRFKKDDVEALEKKIVLATAASEPDGKHFFSMMYRGCATSADQARVQAQLAKSERSSVKRWYAVTENKHFVRAATIASKNPNPPAYLSVPQVGTFSPRQSGRLSPSSPRATSPRASGRLSPRQSGQLNMSGGVDPASPRGGGPTSPRKSLLSPRGNKGSGGGMFGGMLSPRKKAAATAGDSLK